MFVFQQRENNVNIIQGIKKNATTAKWVGTLLIIVGIVSLFVPLAAGLSVAMVIGVLLAFAGVCQLVLAFQAGSFGDGVVVFLLGALSAIVGFYMLAQPGIALATLTLFLAAYFFVSGIAQVVSAFGARCSMSNVGCSMFTPSIIDPSSRRHAAGSQRDGRKRVLDSASLNLQAIIAIHRDRKTSFDASRRGA